MCVCVSVSADPASSLTGLYACIGFFYVVGLFVVAHTSYVVFSY